MNPITSIRSRSAAPLLCAALLGACYHYTPIESRDVAPGMDVRARVTAATAQRIAPLLGVSDQRLITGPVIEGANGTVIIEVPTVAQAGIAGATETLHQRISLAPGDVLEFERRTLDAQKTGIVVGAASVVVIASTIASLRGNSRIDSPGGTTSPPETRIPIIRIRF